MAHDGPQQTDSSQGPSQHVSSMNISAHRVDNNIDQQNARFEQSMSNNATDRQLSAAAPAGFQNHQEIRLEQQQLDVYRAYRSFPANGSSHSGRAYDDKNDGTFCPAANLPQSYQSIGGVHWPHNEFHSPGAHHQSSMIDAAYFVQQGVIPGTQPPAYGYLPGGYDQDYGQQHDLLVAPSLLPHAHTQASVTPVYFATQTQATLAADQAHQPRQQSASHQLLPPAYHGQTVTLSTYTANCIPVPLSFTSRTQARTYQYKRKFDWQCPQNDVTIPQNDAQREDYIHQLKAAIIDISQTSDNSRTFSKRWKNPLATGQSFYEPEHVEIVCRDLIDIAEMLHKGGPATLPIFDKEALKTAARSKDLTFAERFRLMVDLVLDSKTLCDALMRSEKHAVFVACADQKTKNLGHNRKANGDKKVLLKLGYEQREKAKKGHVNEGEEKVEQDDEGEDGVEKSAAPAVAESLHDTLETAQTASQRITQDGNDGLAHTHPNMQREVAEHDTCPLISSPAENHARLSSADQPYAWPNAPRHTRVQLVPYQDNDFFSSDDLVNGTEFDPLTLELGAIQNASELHGQRADAGNIPPPTIESRKRSVDAARLEDEHGRSVKRVNQGLSGTTRAVWGRGFS